MRQISEQQAKQLEKLVMSLVAFVESLDEEHKFVVPLSVQKLVETLVSKRICLQCGTVNPPRYTRGLCANDYNPTMKRIRDDPRAEQRLIAKGLITAESAKGGRKAVHGSVVEEALDEDSDVSVADLPHAKAILAAAEGGESLKVTGGYVITGTNLPKPLEGKELEEHRAEMARADAMRKKTVDDHFRSIEATPETPPRSTKKTGPMGTTQPTGIVTPEKKKGGKK